MLKKKTMIGVVGVEDAVHTISGLVGGQHLVFHFDMIDSLEQSAINIFEVYQQVCEVEPIEQIVLLCFGKDYIQGEVIKEFGQSSNEMMEIFITLFRKEVKNGFVTVYSQDQEVFIQMENSRIVELNTQKIDIMEQIIKAHK